MRRTLIADKLTRETRVRYVVALETAPPTTVNPHGLLIVGQSIAEEKSENP